jgi:DNA-binding IclR family transcriptional regulator
MVEQDAESLRYFVGPECYVMGVIANERFGLGRVAGDAVARLARFSGDTAFFSIRSDTYAVCLLREDGDYPLKTHVLQPGSRHPLGVGAGSLAMLAALDENEVERCLEANAELIASSYPSFSLAMLRNEVTATRKRGFAVNEGFVVAGSWGIGVAVHGADGDVVAALSIAAVASRLAKERRKELAPRLIAEAKALEKQIRDSETLRPTPAARVQAPSAVPRSGTQGKRG